MKTLLIYPPNIATDRNVAYVSAGMPLGVTMLAAMLEREGLDVEILDALNEGFISPAPTDGAAPDGTQRISRGYCRKHRLGRPFAEGSFSIGLGFDEIIRRVAAARPDVVGISIIFSSVYQVGIHIARLIKEHDSNITVVIGGNHATAAPEAVLAEGCVDYVVMGEGEHAFTSLVKCLGEGRARDAAKIPGIAAKDEAGGFIRNTPELIKDMDSLPFPAFHMLPMERYFATSAEGRTLKMMTSRGCTFNCCFCTVPANTRRRFRARSPENVISEIERWIGEYSIEGIMFEDDNMTLNVRRAKDIFRLMCERDYGLRLYARNFRADLFDPELLSLMRRAGFETIWITPESGNQDVLDRVIDKKIDLKDVDRSVELILEAGLNAAAAFVIGIPGEKRSDIEDTVNYARKLKRMGVREFWISIATPIVGTRLYADAVRDGLITGMDLSNFSYLQASINTGEFKASELVAMRESLMAELNARGQAC